jgi:hypothetical protein
MCVLLVIVVRGTQADIADCWLPRFLLLSLPAGRCICSFNSVSFDIFIVISYM